MADGSEQILPVRVGGDTDRGRKIVLLAKIASLFFHNRNALLLRAVCLPRSLDGLYGKIFATRLAFLHPDQACSMQLQCGDPWVSPGRGIEIYYRGFFESPEKAFK